MSDLPNDLIQLVNEVRNGALDDAFHASRQLGLLIERHRQNRYMEESYEVLLSSKELLELRLTDQIIEKLTSELFSIMETSKDRMSLVVWPLGKTFSRVVVDKLLRHLEKSWKENDVVSSEILMAVYDDSLLKDYQPLLERIAKEGGDQSKKLARQRISLNK